MAYYLEQFETLLNDVSRQTEGSLISFFIGGLKKEIGDDLRVVKPTTLRQTFSLVKVYEAKKNSGGGSTSTINSEPLIKTPLVGMKTLPIVRKMLTVEERKECTAKGLCFNCDESYVPGHKCKGRLFRMEAGGNCLIELVEQHCEEIESREEISLHALSGTFNPHTIRLTGWVRNRPLSVLIDSGSTHNFVQESVASRLGYEIQTLPEFKVFIGSGEYLTCRQVCR